MRFGMKMSKDTKETLLGGVAGALTVNMESAANGLLVGYPQPLKDRLLPQIPRNGELLSVLAPVGVTWVVAKKKHSSRVHNVRNGVMFYDLPKLLDLIAYRIAYSMGLPAQSAGMRFNNNNALRFQVNRTTARTPTTSVGNLGKYAIKVNATPKMAVGGLGKYR